MKISVLGATGSMGGLVIKSALQNGFEVINKVSSKDKISDLFLESDAIVDFSCPIATESMLSYVLQTKSKIPLVIGTTSLSQKCFEEMQNCSNFAPIFYSPNMSFLISIVNMTVYAIAKLLDESYDAEILDIHHRLKKDAPSGTALMLGHSIAQARAQNFEDIATFFRYGIIAQRRIGEIGFSSQRGGQTVGEHIVSFTSDQESIKIHHIAHNKEIFAKGAIKAINWITNQKAGLYTMNDFTKDSIIPIVKALYNDFFSSQRKKI